MYIQLTNERLFGICTTPNFIRIIYVWERYRKTKPDHPLTRAQIDKFCFNYKNLLKFKLIN
jgi:hypothetical protein